MAETVLIVDDEESVRRTFQEWLFQSGWDCRLLTAADAEAALVHANREPIDLAILDWNLGTGNDGLQLLDDLSVFQPDIVAILITGFAHQATPLAALRMGVRDYLDKNSDLTRESFLKAVRKQLDRIVPIKQHRELHRSLQAFRQAVDTILPLVQSAATLNDPVPLPRAVASLCRFVYDLTGAKSAVVLIRHVSDSSEESCRAYDADGKLLTDELVPFARSVAATAMSLQEPCVMNRLDPASLGGVELQPFEHGRSSLLVIPMAVGSGAHVIMELFDKPGGFSVEDRKLSSTAAEIGAELMRQALAERQIQRTIFNALDAALTATSSASGQTSIEPTADLPPAVLSELRSGLGMQNAAIGGKAAIELADAVRSLAERYGEPAVKHCLRIVVGVREMLDSLQ